MTSHRLTWFAGLALAGSSLAQSPNLVLSFSQLEWTLSASGGTVLQRLYPNEMAYLNFGLCSSLSSEKWLPRTCSRRARWYSVALPVNDIRPADAAGPVRTH